MRNFAAQFKLTYLPLVINVDLAVYSVADLKERHHVLDGVKMDKVLLTSQINAAAIFHRIKVNFY